MKLSNELKKNLICPEKKSFLKIQDDELVSTEGKIYPVVEGVPILINENRSIFSIEKYIRNGSTTYALNSKNRKINLHKLVPSISVNLKEKDNFKKIGNSLKDDAKILVIGVGLNKNYDHLFRTKKNIEIVGSDVSLGPNTDVILDAHDIPFNEETFDCVVVQAVLEHVIDPYRCASEIYRVTKYGGMVYAETPFMQQVHMGRFDFLRFTHLGHRRLFNMFSELDSGPVAGPGTALAWSYVYFLRSFSKSQLVSKILVGFGSYTSFFLKYFDYYLVDKPGSYDSASCFFFLGRKDNSNVIRDEQIVNGYCGLQKK